VGTGGQFSNHIVPALLICINTFASHIVMSFMLPVLLVTPFTLHVMFSKILPSAAKDSVKNKDMKQGELILYKKDDLLYEGTFILCAKYILFFGIRVSWVEQNAVACSCITYVSFMYFYAGEDVNVKYSHSSLTAGVSAVGKTNPWSEMNLLF
jgi:hypothetical protein